MGDAAAVADDVQAGVLGLQVLVYGNLHVVELDLYTIEQGVVVGGARGDLVQGVDHLNDAVQNPLGQYQAQVAGSCVQCGGDEALLHPLGSGALAPDQIAEALDHDAAAQHIAQAGNGFAVAVGVLEGLGEVLGNQQGKIGVLRLLGGVFVAVAVDSDDAVGVLVNHGPLGVHAEGADLVFVLLGPVDDLALIQLVGQVGEDNGGQLHANADVHTVGLSGDVHVPADLLHPLAAAAAYGDDALSAGVAFAVAGDLIAAVDDGDAPDRGIKMEVHLVLQFGIQVFQHHIVDVRAQVADGSVQQVQVILDTDGLELGPGGGVELGALAAVGHVDLVYVVHQIQGTLLADILVEGTAEVIGDVVLAVGEGAGPAEAAHDGAALAADAALDGGAVDGALPLIQRMACLKNADFQIGIAQGQLVGRKNAAGTGADDQDIVIHGFVS